MEVIELSVTWTETNNKKYIQCLKTCVWGYTLWWLYTLYYAKYNIAVTLNSPLLHFMVTRKIVSDLFKYKFPTLYDNVIQQEQNDKELDRLL